MPNKICKLTKICIENKEVEFKIRRNSTEIFSITNGLKQNNGLSPLLFKIVLDMAINSVNIELEVFSNHTCGTKEMFIKDEEET